MKREILFRGKRADNGEWVEGLLHKRQTEWHCIMYFDNEIHAYFDPSIEKYNQNHKILLTDNIQTFDNFGNLYNFDVNPETIGQFTGMTDKNGKRIFEGDICKVVVELNYSCADKHYENQIGEIVYGLLGSFCLKVGNDKVPIMHFIDNHLSLINDCSRIEVIGNIYDNSEFLK